MSTSIVHAEADAAHLLECKERIGAGECRVFAEVSSDGMLVIRDETYAYANPAAARLLGAVSPEQLIGKTPFDIIHPDDHRSLKESFTPPAEPRPVLAERRAVTLDGRTIGIETLTTHFTGPDGPSMLVVMRERIADRRREEERQHLFSRSLDLQCIAGFNGYFKRLNTAWTKLLGYTEEELLAHPWLDFVHPDDREATLLTRKQTCSGVAVQDFENRFRHKDGSYRWLRWAMNPDMTRKLLFCSAHDITEHKRTEKALRQSEERFRLLVEGATDYAIFLLDCEGFVCSWNIGAERIKGYTEEEIIGRSFTCFYTPEDRECNRPKRLLAQARASGSVQDEGWRIRKNGSQLWADVTITAVYDEVGTHVGFSKIVRDLTQHKLVADLMAQSEQRYRALFETAGSLILSISTDGRILSMNKATEALTGLPRIKAVGSALVELLVPERERPAAWDFFHMALHGELVRGIEFSILATDGERTCAWNLDRLTNELGQPIGVIAVGTDVTERRQAETRLEEMNAKLLTLAKALEQIREHEQQRIARELHDELGHQLTAMKLDIDYLGNLLQRGRRQTRSHLMDCVQHMSRLLDTTFVSVRRMAHTLRPDVLDRLGLTAALETLVDDIRSSSDLRVDLTVGPNVRQIGLSDRISMVVFRIAQEAVTNILRHAEASQVAIRLQYHGGKLTVDIEDDGKGFDERRYDPSRSFGLTGMKERVAMIEGTLAIRKRPGGGTVVTACIPVSEGSQ